MKKALRFYLKPQGFLRAAAKAGTAMLVEGTEEALQEMLTPLFENIAIGTQKNTPMDIDWDQTAYIFLLGAISGGVSFLHFRLFCIDEGVAFVVSYFG